jgi:transcription initiation factor TFIIB
MQPSIISCSKCELDHLIADPDSGEMVCSICGLVVQEKMEETKIQFHTQGTDLRTRATEPSSLSSYDMGLSTTIGKTDKDGKGQKIQPFAQSTIKRLRKWNQMIQLHDSKNRNLIRAFSLLYTLKGKFNLSDATIEKVAYIYRKALLKRLIRGRSIEPVLAAAVYIAIGDTLASTSLKEISDVSNIRLKTVSRMVRLLASELDILLPIADPARCVTKVGNIAGLSEKTKREAVDLMSHIKETEYPCGKKPMALAATILYVACSKTGEYISQKEIAKAAGVTDVTIRARFRDLKARNLV